jgi:hypothetical protein
MTTNRDLADISPLVTFVLAFADHNSASRSYHVSSVRYTCTLETETWRSM